MMITRAFPFTSARARAPPTRLGSHARCFGKRRDLRSPLAVWSVGGSDPRLRSAMHARMLAGCSEHRSLGREGGESARKSPRRARGGAPGCRSCSSTSSMSAVQVRGSALGAGAGSSSGSSAAQELVAARAAHEAACSMRAAWRAASHCCSLSERRLFLPIEYNIFRRLLMRSEPPHACARHERAQKLLALRGGCRRPGRAARRSGQGSANCRALLAPAPRGGQLQAARARSRPPASTRARWRGGERSRKSILHF